MAAPRIDDGPMMAERPRRSPVDIGARPLVRDDVAYILPMAIFMAFTWVGGTWKSIYPITYVIKVIVVAVALAVLWRHYTKISWRYWWLGVCILLSVFKSIRSKSGAFRP